MREAVAFSVEHLADVLEAQRAEFAATPDPLDTEHFDGLVLDARPLPEKAPDVALQLVAVLPPFYAPMAAQTLRNAAGMLDEGVKLLKALPPHRADIVAYKLSAESNAKALRRIANQLEARPRVVNG